MHGILTLEPRQHVYLLQNSANESLRKSMEILSHFSGVFLNQPLSSLPTIIHKLYDYAQ